MSRKKVFDFYGRKKYFRELEWKTELMRHVNVYVFWCYCFHRCVCYSNSVRCSTVAVFMARTSLSSNVGHNTD